MPGKSKLKTTTFNGALCLTGMTAPSAGAAAHQSIGSSSACVLEAILAALLHIAQQLIERFNFGGCLSSTAPLWTVLATLSVA